MDIFKSQNLNKLKGQENYKIWRMQAHAALTAASLFKYIEGSKQAKPVALSGSPSTHEQIEEWEAKDASARSMLMLTCVVDIVLSMEHISTAREIWQFLENRYAPKGKAQKFAKFAEWSTIEFDGRNLEAFCNSYQATLRGMKENNIKIDDELLVWQFLIHVAPHYPQFAFSYRERIRDSKADEVLQLDNVIAKLLDEQLSEKTEKANYTRHSSNTNGDLKPKGKGKGGRGKTGEEKGKKTCSHCKMQGHDQDNCFKLHPEKKDEFEQRKAKKNRGNDNSGTGSGSGEQRHMNFFATTIPEPSPPIHRAFMASKQ